MGRQRHPVPPPRPVVTTELEEPLHAVAVPGVRLEQLGEALVVDRGAGQGPADVLGDVVVAEAHLVGQAERPLGHLGPGPPPDAVDSLGHYLRTELMAKLACGAYATTPVAECNANFRSAPAGPAPETARLATRVRALGSRAREPARKAGEPVLDYLLGGDR